MTLVTTWFPMVLSGAAGVGGIFAGAAVFGLLQFAFKDVLKPSPYTVHYTFKIGLNGAGTNEGYEPLEGAGGRAPRIRAFDNLGRLIGKTSRKTYCTDGQDFCPMKIKEIKEQPAYGLFVGRTDPICVAAIAVDYTGGDKYGWVGNWAHACSHPWYYSDIDAQLQNASVKLDCAWLGKYGYERGYPTGIRIHFTEFVSGFRGHGNNEQYYCSENNTALQFYYNPSPKYFDGKSREQKNKAEMVKQTENFKRSSGMETRSVLSHYEGHSANQLCKSETSVGPSLVSVNERTFCHMPDKVLYPFCKDVDSGACWDDEAHAFDAKGTGALAVRAALPNIKFDQPLIWGKKK